MNILEVLPAVDGDDALCMSERCHGWPRARFRTDDGIWAGFVGPDGEPMPLVLVPGQESVAFLTSLEAARTAEGAAIADWNTQADSLGALLPQLEAGTATHAGVQQVVAALLKASGLLVRK